MGAGLNSTVSRKISFFFLFSSGDTHYTVWLTGSDEGLFLLSGGKKI